MEEDGGEVLGMGRGVLIPFALLVEFLVFGSFLNETTPSTSYILPIRSLNSDPRSASVFFVSKEVEVEELTTATDGPLTSPPPPTNPASFNASNIS